MPEKSRWPLAPLHASIPSFVFGSPNTKSPLADNKLIIDAKRPETHYWTLSTYLQWSKRFAAGLVAAGFQPGDRLMLFSGNSNFTPIVVMGVLMAGGVFNSANPAFTPRELAYQLKNCEPVFVLAAKNCLERAHEGVEKAGMIKEMVLLFDEVGHFENGQAQIPSKPENSHWMSLFADDKAGEVFVWEELNTAELSNRTAVLIYSSGTTGLPKGVELSHFNIVTNMRQLTLTQLSDKSITERRSLCVLPMYHGLGLIYYGLVAPKMGIQVYLMERYNLMEMLQHITRYKITELLLVPPILSAMAKLPKIVMKEFDLTSVKKVVAGVAPIGKELTEQFEDLWHGKMKLRQAFGMTEAPCISLCWDEQASTGPSSTSVGELVPGMEAKLVSDSGVEVTTPISRGELWLRGLNIMKGYWRNEKATKDTKTQDGWLKTGDIAYFDREKGNVKWYIVDRKKELIKVRGAQVAPAELEALLLEHPMVIDSAVIGVKTATDDEDPRAYVVPRNISMVSEEDILQFVNCRVAKLKRLTGGVIFTDWIPRNPSGKILRRVLRDQCAMESRQSQARL